VSLAIGVDIGGTKTAVGLVADDGSVVTSTVVPTPARDAGALFATVAARIADLTAGLPAGDAAAPIGIGVAGLVEASGRRVMFAPHLDLDGVDVAARFEALTRRDVEVENDVAAAAWAEFTFGAGRGADPLLVVTVGTGLGGGIVIGGELMLGATGAAAEVGHVPFVPGGRLCACGARGCWEQYASGNALARAGRELVASGGPGVEALREACAGDVEALTGRMITDLAHAGDPASIDVVVGIGEVLGEGLAGVVAVLDPQRVVVGGGAATVGDLMLDPARRALQARVIGGAHRMVPAIVAAEFGEQATMVGAAELARSRFAAA
jgi:glucokinase